MNTPSKIQPGCTIPLLIYPDPRLQLVCDPVEIRNDMQLTLWPLLDAMWETLEYYKGWGLAAPQLGSPVRVIIVHVQKQNGSGCKIEIINPELSVYKRYGKFLSDEGCLSWPGKRTTVRRWCKVTVKGFDRWGDPVVFGGRGDQAAALQHEVEHLYGINLADHCAE